MTRIASRGPLGLKDRTPKAAKKRKPLPAKSKKRETYYRSEEGREDLAYMGKVRCLPCVICEGWGMIQRSQTEAHHCKSGRYSSARENDRLTIPLCHSHHNKLVPVPGDEDKIGYHNGQETWEALYGPDYEFIDVTIDAVEALF